MEKQKISALVASYNEGHLLEDCLKSLQFCEEIYFVNLGSTDNSVEIAKKYATVVEEYHWVPLIEDIHPVFIPKLKHNWFILIDPDERISEGLANDIEVKIRTGAENLVCIRVPFQNYFKGRLLKGTAYGGVKYGRLLYRRDGVTIDYDVHAGIKMKEGTLRQKLFFTGNNANHHYWCNSWSQLFEKHKRYLAGEGQRYYNSGNRFSLKMLVKRPLRKLHTSFIVNKGYKDGLLGLALSLVNARYEFLCWWNLRKFENSLTD